jgi:hypothetical protein
VNHAVSHMVGHALTPAQDATIERVVHRGEHAATERIEDFTFRRSPAARQPPSTPPLLLGESTCTHCRATLERYTSDRSRRFSNSGRWFCPQCPGYMLCPTCCTARKHGHHAMKLQLRW